MRLPDKKKGNRKQQGILERINDDIVTILIMCPQSQQYSGIYYECPKSFIRATYLLFFANLNQWLSAKYLAISGDIFGCHTASKRVDSYWDLLVESREVAKYSKMHRLTPKTLKKKKSVPKVQ